MSDTPPIKKVWIEEGCISCQRCQDVAPEVFFVADDADCVVRPEAPRQFGEQSGEIEQAAEVPAKDVPSDVEDTKPPRTPYQCWQNLETG